MDLDPNRKETAVKLISQFAKKHQIIFTTCNPDTANLLGLAPAPLYVSYEDVYEMVERIIKIMENKEYENLVNHEGLNSLVK
ncbi:MAG: hypothetical protein PHP29_06470 [Tissierellia bacterium]|nr:hypothetical protein [Tissierellia bacterium]